MKSAWVKLVTAERDLDASKTQFVEWFFETYGEDKCLWELMYRQGNITKRHRPLFLTEEEAWAAIGGRERILDMRFATNKKSICPATDKDLIIEAYRNHVRWTTCCGCGRSELDPQEISSWMDDSPCCDDCEPFMTL